MRFLCVLAMPRTGSSHLNKLLRSIPEINAKSELFHKRVQVVLAPRELREIEKRAGVGTVADKDAFAAWRRANPAATLEALRDAGRNPIVAFKVFPDHLRRPLIEEQLFARGDIGFAVLRRRPIECFISSRKALQAGTFTLIDTTDLKVALSPGEFAAWARTMRQWYRWIRRSLDARGPYAAISYEEHLDGMPAERSLTEIVARLAPLGFDLTMPAAIIEGARQDKEPRYQDRVANWDAFEAEVRADPDSAPLLDWAQRAG